MNTNKATYILNIAGGVTTHLHEDFNDFHTKLFQTEQDINRLKTFYRRIKEIRVAADYEDDGSDPEEVTLTTSEALMSLGKAITRMETKMEFLNICIHNSNAAD